MSDQSVIDSGQATKSSYMETEKAMKTVAFSPFVPEKFDYLTIDYSGSNYDVYIYKLGGSSGLVVGTLKLTFTDTGKGTLSSVEKVV